MFNLKAWWKVLFPTLQFVECPVEPGNYLLWRFDVDSAKPALGALLTVREQEEVLFLDESGVVARFGPGLYQLDRQCLGDLAKLYSWPADFRGPIETEILFVSTTRKERAEWKAPGPVSIHDRLVGNVRIELSGDLEFEISNSVRLITIVLDNGVKPDTASVQSTITRTIITEICGFIERTEMHLAQLVTVPRDVCRLVAPALQKSLTEQGITSFRLSINLFRMLEDAVAVDTSVTRVIEFARPEAEPHPDSDQSAVVEQPSTPPEVQIEKPEIDHWGDIKFTPGSKATHPLADSSLALLEPFSLPDSLLEERFYIAVDEDQTGPFSAEEFEKTINEGGVSAQTLIWFSRLDKWKNAIEIKELETAFYRK